MAFVVLHCLLSVLNGYNTMESALHPLLELRAIHFTATGRSAPLLSDVNLAVMPGQRIGLLGNNGSGKSTLLHIATGLIRPVAGTVSHDGKACSSESDFLSLRLQTGYLLQHAADQLFCTTILEDVAFGPYNQGKSQSEARKLAESMLALLKLEALAHCNGGCLSGGEQKLAALATVLVMQPKLLLLDEPTNDLDPDARERLIAAVEQTGLPLVAIAHDRDFLARLCTHWYCLEQGKLRETTL